MAYWRSSVIGSCVKDHQQESALSIRHWQPVVHGYSTYQVSARIDGYFGMHRNRGGVLYGRRKMEMEMKMEIQVEASEQRCWLRCYTVPINSYFHLELVLFGNALEIRVKGVDVGKGKTRREFNMIRTRTAYGNFAEIPGHTHDEDREQVRWARQLDCVQLNPLSGAHFAIALGGRVG
jgi:hypothetical protein